jgi:hypothetical protein
MLLTLIGTNFALVQPVCGNGWLPLLHALSATALGATLGCGWLAWNSWRRIGRSWPGDETGVAARARFMAALGVLMSAFAALSVAAQWSINFLVNPCQ